MNRIEVDYAVDPLCLHARSPARYPFLLQSTATGTPRSRFDILFAFPEEAMILSAEGALSGDGAPSGAENFLDALDAWYAKEGIQGNAEEGLPFCGGWFIYLSYELAGQIEPTVGMAEIDEPWLAFRQRNIDLFKDSKELLSRYYSEGHLFSERAREHFVLPDKLASN